MGHAFGLTAHEILSQHLVDELFEDLEGAPAGAVVTFEGRVRDHNLGLAVSGLEYDVYPELALREGEQVVAEAMSGFQIRAARAVHRHGLLGLKDVAVVVAVAAGHRDAAFLAARFIIDELKLRLPIWKREIYTGGHHSWIGCEGCSKGAHRHRSTASAGPEREAHSTGEHG